jgi:tetraacyldisaccharide 4'-kinase
MNSSMKSAFAPLGGLYGVAGRARRALYDQGLLRVHKVSAPVISVGNITLGGTGKTPLVAWIAKKLANEGRHVCILTRGYGRVDSQAQVIVSYGNEVLAGPERAGDEAFLLAEELKGCAAVISNADRVAAAHWALEKLKTDVFVLDDGFQHLRIARDLDLVTIDATNPWGNRKLLPAGILREPLGALTRADCLVVTRTDAAQQLEELENELVPLSKGASIFRSCMNLARLRRAGGEESSIVQDEVKRSSMAAFCGIGNPESFFALLNREGFRLCHTRALRDHHRYVQADLDRLERDAIAKGARALLTTAKDEVKLRSIRTSLPCYAVDIEIEIEKGEAFSALINRAMGSAPPERSTHGALNSPNLPR